MITPPGTFDLSKYTRQSEMNFSIAGLKATEHGTISMPLSNVFVEPNTGVKVMVHVPAVSNAAGAANPQVQTNELQRSVGIATYYPITSKVLEGHRGRAPDFPPREEGEPEEAEAPEAEAPAAEGRGEEERGEEERGEEERAGAEGPMFNFCITDFKNRDFAEINVSLGELVAGLGVEWRNNRWMYGREEAEVFLLRPQMTCLMESAIVVNEPGAATGSLLVGYPSTGISTSQ